ncbi:MAG: hypothetical protein AVDCRST_MAG93-8287, partial [uncultured Chloroflexia bacterium]
RYEHLAAKSPTTAAHKSALKELHRGSPEVLLSGIHPVLTRWRPIIRADSPLMRKELISGALPPISDNCDLREI